MDVSKKQLPSDHWMKASSSNELLDEICQDRNQLFSNYDSQQREKSSNLDYDVLIRKKLETIPSSLSQIKLMQEDLQAKSKPQLWDPKTMLSNLSIMEDKIHQLQELVQFIVSKASMDQRNEILVQQQQQLVTADLTSIIIQLISTAGSLLPAVKHPTFSANQNPNPNPNPNPSAGNGIGSLPQHNTCDDHNDSDGNTHWNMVSKVEDHSNETDHMDVHEEHDDDIDEGEHLPPGSYEILQLEKDEILAPHTHFCVICGKGFKRDANLRMHMRGHGDEYKTAAALAKPHKDQTSEVKLIKRYSCPYVGCKRNKDHKKFQPLKTILCVKNHYKRTHCDKSYTCSRCNTKKFSVIADLKTHEKHCGRDRWICSCGTTFSRKDKLFGHISLFQGHTPAIPMDEQKSGAVGGHDHSDDNNNTNTNTNNNNLEGSKEDGFFDFNFNSNGLGGEPSACFSPLNMETCNMNRFQEFPRTLFEDSDNFSFLLSGSCNYLWKNGGESSSKDL